MVFAAQNRLRASEVFGTFHVSDLVCLARPNDQCFLKVATAAGRVRVELSFSDSAAPVRRFSTAQCLIRAWRFPILRSAFFDSSRLSRSRPVQYAVLGSGIQIATEAPNPLRLAEHTGLSRR